MVMSCFARGQGLSWRSESLAHHCCVRLGLCLFFECGGGLFGGLFAAFSVAFVQSVVPILCRQMVGHVCQLSSSKEPRTQAKESEIN